MLPTCPDLDRLNSFVLGRLSAAEADPISHHLDQCLQCVNQLQQLHMHDPLLDALRTLESATPSPDTAHVEVLIGRLRRLALSYRGAHGAAPEETPTAFRDDDLPRTLGRYEIRRRLGAGGMGTVYEAHDPQLKRLVAVKVPRFTGAPGEEAARKRFLREARSAAAIRHPHVCPIHDVGEHDGRPFVVMARIDGQSLAERLRQRGPCQDCREVARLGIQIAQALAAVHEHGIVHRDLKPGNILLDQAGQAVLTDFGVARMDLDDEALTHQGAVLGTPAYMAPEQILPRLGDVDARADIYSLGIVLHQFATGRLQTADTKQANAPLSDPYLDAIIGKATAWKPADRYQHARELAGALEDWMARSVTGTVIQPKRAAFLRRKPWLAIAACLVLTALTAFTFLVGHKSETETLPTQPSEIMDPWSGWIDVRIWEPGNTGRHDIRLDQPVLPLKAGDQVRIEAEVNRPAFLYVLWIDSEGKAWPIYPWPAGKWNRPAQEQAVKRLRLPSQPDGGWPIETGPAGMETLVLLARDTPLPADVDLAALLTGLPVQTAQHMRAAVWFENGEVVRKEALRAPSFFNPQRIDDPILTTLSILKQRLQPHFRFSRAVSFANQGDSQR